MNGIRANVPLESILEGSSGSTPPPPSSTGTNVELSEEASDAIDPADTISVTLAARRQTNVLPLLAVAHSGTAATKFSHTSSRLDPSNNGTDAADPDSNIYIGLLVLPKYVMILVV
jgi:hypothetical protein